MIELMFQQVRVRAEFVAVMQAHTDGNPFFIEETLRSLAANGDIYREDGVWTRKPLEELRIPRTLDDAVQRRLSRLSDPARELLKIAAQSSVGTSISPYSSRSAAWRSANCLRCSRRR
jgi:predicted ATPase